ncbi:MAG: hypothetical protein K0S24_1340 [Sphingobacterium sp.]|nr:hypothetical protein [Sphingobacterium sp.]
MSNWISMRLYMTGRLFFIISLFFCLVCCLPKHTTAQSELVIFQDSSIKLAPRSARQILGSEKLSVMHSFQRDSCLVYTNLKKNFSKNFQLDIQTDTVFHNPKRLWTRAGIEWFSFQALPASFNYFVRKDPYSHISLNNWIKHLNPKAWAWDDNAFATNQIAHPYHGQLYFNAFRSNNFTFWESSVATVAGSFLWETAGETQAPSINDLVNTSFGGIILGEMTHRLSQNVLSRPTHSVAERQSKEFLAFLINPINGLNRLLDGRWGRVVKGQVIDSSHVQAEFDLGVKRFDAKEGNIIEKGKNDIYARVKLLYTNGEVDQKKPFDDFYVNLEVGSDDSSFVNSLNVYASLYGKRIFKKLPGRHLGIVSANYDFIHNEAFFYGAQSVNYNVISNFTFGKHNKLTTTIGGGPVVLAAVPDPYLRFGDSRNYNYGPGADLRGSIDISVWKRLKLGLNYHGGYFVTLSGNDSHYFLHTAAANASLRLLKNFSLNASSGYFRLEGNFKDYPDIDKDYPFVRLSLGYNVLF